MNKEHIKEIKCRVKAVDKEMDAYIAKEDFEGCAEKLCDALDALGDFSHDNLGDSPDERMIELSLAEYSNAERQLVIALRNKKEWKSRYETYKYRLAMVLTELSFVLAEDFLEVDAEGTCIEKEATKKEVALGEKGMPQGSFGGVYFGILYTEAVSSNRSGSTYKVDICIYEDELNKLQKLEDLAIAGEPQVLSLPEQPICVALVNRYKRSEPGRYDIEFQVLGLGETKKETDTLIGSFGEFRFPVLSVEQIHSKGKTIYNVKTSISDDEINKFHAAITDSQEHILALPHNSHCIAIGNGYEWGDSRECYIKFRVVAPHPNLHL